MTDKGVTLIELIVVTLIIGILAIALGFSYVGWQGRYSVEKATKDIYSDLMTARNRAMQRNHNYFADFPTATSYQIVEDSNDNSSLNIGAGDNVVPPSPKTIEYPVQIGAVAGVPPVTLTFNKGGIMSPETTICIFTDADGDGTSDNDPDYDCIVISQTRINMGKLTSQAIGDCDADHCTVK